MDASAPEDPDYNARKPVTLANRYTLHHPIGSGTYGQVYAAYDEVRDRQVAIKILRTSRASSLIRFKNEFRTISGIRHPNLVRVHNLGRDGDTWFIVMELVDGLSFSFKIHHNPDKIGLVNADNRTSAATILGSLQTIAVPPEEARKAFHPRDGGQDWAITTAPALTVQEIQNRMAQLCQGILALHRAHVIHCDLKPSNVLVTPDERVVILDFGVSRMLQPSNVVPEAAGGFLGTPYFMPPEAHAGEAPTAAFDWYATGMMLAQLLSEERADTLHDTPWKSLRTNFKQGAERFPDYQPLFQLATNLLHPNPSKRANQRAILSVCGPDTSGSSTRSTALDAPAYVDPHSLHRMHELWGQYEQGNPVILMLEGADGLGKNNLCQAFLDTRLRRDAVPPWVLSAKCKRNELVGYRAFDELMDGVASIIHALPADDRQALVPYCTPSFCRLFPALYAFASGFDDGDATSTTDTAPPLVAFEGLLSALSAQHPIIIWIADIDEADQDSLRWLAHIFSPGTRPRCFLLLTKRSESTISDETFDIDTLGYAIHRLPLHPMDNAAANEFIDSLLPSNKRHVKKLRAHLLQQGQGRPVWLQAACYEALHSKQQQDNNLLQNDHQFKLPPLTKEQLQVLQIASLCVDKPTFFTFRALTRLNAETLNTVLDELTDQQLLTQHLSSITRGNKSHEEQYDIADGRILKSVQQSMSSTRVLDIHDAFVDAVDNQHLELTPTALCAHLIGAKHFQRAEQYALQLIQFFEEAAAWNGGSLMYRYLRDILEHEGKTMDQQMQLRMVHTLIRAGHLREAANQLSELANNTPYRRDTRHLHQRAASLYTMCGEYALADVHRKQSQSTARSVLHIPTPTVASLLWYYNRTTRRMDQLDLKKLSNAPLSQREENTLRGYRQAGLDIGILDIVKGVEMGLQELDYVLTLKRKVPLAQTLSFLVTFISAVGTRQRVVAQYWADVAKELAARANDPAVMAFANVAQASIDYHRGDYGTAWPKMQESYEWLRRNATNDAMRYYTKMHHVYVAHMVGDVNALRTSYYSQLIEARAQNNLIMEAAVTFPGFVTWLLDDAPDAGVSALERVRMPSPKRAFFRLSDFFQQQFNAEAFLYRQDTQNFDQHIRKLARYDQTVAAWVMELPRQAARYLRARMMLAQATLHGYLSPEDRRIIKSIATSMAQSDDLLIQAWGYMLGCGVCVLTGRRILAAARLEQALISLEKGGIRLYAETARAAGQVLDLLPCTDSPYDVLQGMGVANPKRFVETYHPYCITRGA